MKITAAAHRIQACEAELLHQQLLQFARKSDVADKDLIAAAGEARKTSLAIFKMARKADRTRDTAPKPSSKPSSNGA